MAWPAPVPDFSLEEVQTRFEELVATTPKDLEGSNLLLDPCVLEMSSGETTIWKTYRYDLTIFATIGQPSTGTRCWSKITCARSLRIQCPLSQS